MKTTVLVGNPKPRSRTLEFGVLVARKLTGSDPDKVIDLVDLGAALLDFGNAAVADSIRTVQESDIVVVASPTFKATYSGILKLYLDQVPPDGFGGTIALPVMLGGGLGHAMAADLLLKPVLVELGAICPASGLYLLDSTFSSDPKLEAWAARVRPMLRPRVADAENRSS
jgi:FMN reductase